VLKKEYPKPSEKRCPLCGDPLLRNQDTVWCHSPCDFGPYPYEDVDGAKVWESEPKDKHSKAFIYYLARRGDCEVRIRHSEDTVNIIMNEQPELT